MENNTTCILDDTLLVTGNKRFFNYLLFAILFLFSFESYSQISVTGYSSYVFGMNTSKTKAISFDMKIFANNYIDNLPIELNAFYNFKTKEYHRFSIGIGLNVSPFRGFDEVNAIVVPVSLEIFPIKDFKRIAVVLELTPEFRVEDDVTIRSLLGIRYIFDQKR